jgi:hypothetical protein
MVGCVAGKGEEEYRLVWILGVNVSLTPIQPRMDIWIQPLLPTRGAGLECKVFVQGDRRSSLIKLNLPPRDVKVVAHIYCVEQRFRQARWAPD